MKWNEKTNSYILSTEELDECRIEAERITRIHEEYMANPPKLDLQITPEYITLGVGFVLFLLISIPISLILTAFFGFIYCSLW